MPGLLLESESDSPLIRAVGWPQEGISNPGVHDEIHLRFVPVSLVPSANVGFALRRTRPGGPTAFQGSDDVQAIKRELVAVKIADEGESVAREVTCLQRIKQFATGRREASRIIEMLDCDGTPSQPPMWYAMRAFTGRLDLDAVHSRMMRPVHRGFAFHIFLQVGEALQFLHETCGVAHQDLHMGNIMVDTARQDIEGLPNLVIVDLEFSVLRQEGGNEKRLTQLMQRDRECFCQIVYRFLVRKRSCNMCVHWKPHDGCPDAANWPAQFNVFRQCMRGWSRRDPAPAWKDLLGRFTDLAVMGRFQMSEQDLKDLKELIWGLVEADEKRLERDIRKALPFLGPKVSEV